MPYNMPPTYTSTSSYEDPREHKAKDVQDFLNKIAYLESSSGRNTNHPLVTSGLNAGTNAVGNYGLMPLTAQDLDKNTGVNQLQDMEPGDVQEKLKQDPELTKRLAATMASKLLQKNPSDVAAYKWEQGQNTQPDQEDLDNSERVRRFKVLQSAR